jgi:restriction endonuclease Mrr
LGRAPQKIVLTGDEANSGERSPAPILGVFVHTTTVVETAIAAADQIEDAQAQLQAPQPLEEIIADKGSVATFKTVTEDAPSGTGRRSLRQPDRTAGR